MSGAFLAGVVAGYGIAVPVGAIGVLIAGLSARVSLRVGAAAGLGAATADGIYAVVAVAGGAAIAGLITPIATPLRWVAAVVLLALAAVTTVGAVRSRGRPPAEKGRPASALRAYLGILGLTLLNPATVVYFAALVLGRGGAGGGVWFVVGAFLASASWQLVISSSAVIAGLAIQMVVG
jgi:arginine exporter protein ArgO